MRKKSFYLSLAAVTILIATSFASFIPFCSENTAFDAEEGGGGDESFPGTTARIVAGTNHTMVLKADGTVWSWGSNSSGQLGDGTTTNRSYPVQIKTSESTYLSNITAIAGGQNHTVALKSDGTVWSWGSNSSGQLGDGTTTNRSYPVQIKTSESTYLSNIIAIGAGLVYTAVLKSDGTVWSWGLNSYGQLGDGTTTNRLYPVQAKTSESVYLTGITSIETGLNHTVALKSGGAVWATGYNGDGRVGDGTNVSKSYFVQVKISESAFLTGVTMIEAGGRQTFAMKGDGSVWAWGSNVFGQLGDGTTVSKVFAVQVKTSESTYLANVKTIAGGESHMAVLKTDGSVWVLGYNVSGQIGDGTTTNRSYPVQVKTSESMYLSNITAIAAGANHTVALKTDGSVWVWGSNSNGQLGDGTTTNRSYPVQTKADASTYLYIFVHIAGITIASEGSGTMITTDDGTLQMSATILPSDADGAVIWSVSDNNVATIDSNGLLTALSNGTVTVKATANDGSGVFDEFEVTISGQTVSGDGGIDPMILAVIAIVAIAAVGGVAFYFIRRR